MISIDIKTNFPAVARKLQQLPTDVGNSAMRRALNRVIDTGKSQMVKRIAGEFNIKQAKVRERLYVGYATKSGSSIILRATLEAGNKQSGRAMNVIWFLDRRRSPREARRAAKGGMRKQLLFQFKRRGGPKQIQGAFIGNEGRTVFRRLSRARLPIAPVNVIDIPQMFNTIRLNEPVRKLMLERFEKEFAQQAAFFLSRIGR